MVLERPKFGSPARNFEQFGFRFWEMVGLQAPKTPAYLPMVPPQELVALRIVIRGQEFLTEPSDSLVKCLQGIPMKVRTAFQAAKVPVEIWMYMVELMDNGIYLVFKREIEKSR